MAIAKLRVGDTVKVIAGKNKNSFGTILKIDGDNVYVKGINLLKKTIRVDRRKPIDEQDLRGFRSVEAPMHRSNIVLYDSVLNKTIKVAIKEIDGKRVRVDRKSNEVIVQVVKAS